jgi:hypothetical protein
MLLARPIPFTDESQSSILMRATHLNGWTDTHTMLKGRSNRYIQSVGMFRDQKKFREKVDLLGIVLPPELSLCQMRRSSSAVMLSLNSNLELPAEVFREEGNAVCPGCIKIFPYLKRIWSLRLISTCDLHGCLLITTCPKCLEGLDWSRPAPHLCKCSFDLCNTPLKNGDIVVARAVMSVIDSGDQARVTDLAEKFLALTMFFSTQEHVPTEEEINSLAIKGQAMVLAYLTNYVTHRVDREHPRIAMASLLKNSGYMRALALDVLREVATIAIPPVAISPIKGTFNGAESAAALGLSKPSYVTGLLRVQLLEVEKTKYVPNYLDFTKASLDALLRKLWVRTTEQNCAIRQRPLTEKIPQLVLDILDRPIINAGYDMEKGLCSLRRMVAKGKDYVSAQLTHLWTVEEAADQLDIYPKIVRSMLRKRWLIPHKVLYQGRRIFISKEQLAEFNEQYIFVSTLAKSVGASRTQFMHYLASHGIRPVGGPGIDGLSIYLVARKDLANLDLTQLRIKRCGLKVDLNLSQATDDAQEDLSDYLTISEVAQRLDLSVILVGRLVRDGKLERVPAPIDAVAVSRTSFEAFRDRMVDRSLKEIKPLLNRFQESREEFIARWVTTGITTIIDVGNRECIRNSEYQTILKLKRNYMTAKEAAIQFDRGKNLLPNLEARGLISAVRMGSGQGIKLFRRRDVALLLKK